MARRKEQRRQSKEQLATTIRKHFNGQGIQENDAVVEFLYKTKFQGMLAFDNALTIEQELISIRKSFSNAIPSSTIEVNRHANS